MRPYAFLLVGLLAVSIAGCGKVEAPAQPEARPVAQPVDSAPPAQPPAAQPPKAGQEAVVYRDTWGVPHIFADDMAGAAYAMGYAQAEDRLEDIYKNVRTAVGTMAEAFGPKYVEQDYIMRVFRNAEICRAYWEKAPTNIRALGDSFMKGVLAYVNEHPEKNPEFATDLHGWQCAAIGRAMILNWPIGTIMDDLHNKKEAPEFGSNAFAVAPSRSAEGCSILMTDPHLTWEGMAVFYEARVHAGGEDLCGYCLVGSPIPALGHNADVAWACTTGGPDTSDVYMVKLNPDNPLQYQYEGEWRDFEFKQFTINVKGEDPQEKPALYSLYGPVVEEPNFEKGVAYCGATPYFDQTDLFEQMYLMATADNCEQFYQALAMNQMMEQNLTFADRLGNIQYVRTGRTPIRPEGYNWSAPVPGGTDKTRWKGIHDIADLVQVKNPPQGYFQNCNVSPAVMMKDSPMTPDKYLPYIYNVSWDDTSPRGDRLLQLLSADERITKDEAIDYMMNVYDLMAQPWQTALQNAVSTAGRDRMADQEFARAVNAILSWDGQFIADRTACPLVKFWRLKCQKQVDVDAIADLKPLSEEDKTKLLDLLAETMAEMKEEYGKWDIAWGDINLVGRSGRYFPCDGAAFGKGKNETETVRDVGVRELEGQPGKYVGNNGSSTMLIAFMHPEGVESYSLVVWGQSADPNSPHHTDQAEKLYGSRQVKPTWFKKEDLMEHIESEKVLTVP